MGKAGQGQGGGCTGFKACVCGAWRWPNVKVVFFLARLLVLVLPGLPKPGLHQSPRASAPLAV